MKPTISSVSCAKVARVCLCVVGVLLTAFQANASTDSPAPVEPLLAVTPESLLHLRAAARVEKPSYQLMDTAQGPLPMDIDGMSDTGSASRALKKAFPTVPFCREWPPTEEIPRFPFAVEANERLVDALDKLEENSSGAVTWLLSHGRVVITAQTPSRDVMERQIAVEVNADTLLQALEQIEGAYNERYSDYPFLVRPASPRLMLRSRPDAVEGGDGFRLRTEGSLREVVLAIMGQLEDAGICYGLSDDLDQEGRRFFVLHLSKQDAPELRTFADLEESTQFEFLLENSKQRLQAYFATNVERAAKAAEQDARGEATP